MSKQQASVDVLSGNKLIAEFDMKGLVHPIDLKYHSSWDWLIPAFEKIDKVDAAEWAIHWNYTTIFGPHESPPYINCSSETSIEAAWLALIKFIQWYNTQTKKQ